MKVQITSDLFLAYLQCPTKCWLWSLGERGVRDSYSDWDREQNESYYGKGIQLLLKGVPENECAFSPAATECLKIAEWRLGVGIPLETPYRKPKRPRDSTVLSPLHDKGGSLRGSLSNDQTRLSLATQLHAIHHLSSGKGAENDQFFPIRYIFRNKVKRGDKLLLAFDTLVLSQVVRRNVSSGKIIFGDDYTSRKIEISPLIAEVRKTIEKLTAQQSNPSPPDLVLNRHCIECEFQVRCRQKAMEADDLSLLANMTEKERSAHHSKGVFTVTQLSYTFRLRRKPKRTKDRREKYHHSLKAMAIREKKIYVIGRPTLDFEGTPVFLDVEGLPDSDFYYLIGVRLNIAESPVQYSLWAERPDQEKGIWGQFLSIISGVHEPVLIHYGHFETTFIRQMTKRFGNAPEGSITSNALGSSVNLLSLIFGQIYFPCFSNGLKDVARFLGFEWSQPNTSGLQTIQWRKNWQREQESSLKEKLIRYNAEDCEALSRVLECLRNLCDSNPEIPGVLPNGVVYTDALPRPWPHIYRQNQFALPEFEYINRASYWDYQRDRILVKDNARIRRPPRGVDKPAKERIKVNKVVTLPPPACCSACGGVRLYRHQAYTTLVLDVMFVRSGVKRWVTKQLYWRYRCVTCGAVFRNSAHSCKGGYFGPNVRALTIYLSIGLRMPQQRVAIFLNDVLGFRFSRTVTSGFKSRAAEFYKPTTEKLLEKILSGPLIHADETKVNIRGQMAYVWVFTSLEEVVYIYAATREGSWVIDLLKDFNGVLVSDFYSVYDSLNCRKQKCLIHLIRDINEDLLKEPFNEEIKSLAADFASLVKPIIKTIERFGLKARFLKKHKKNVERFFKGLLRQKYYTDTAVKCQARLEKNRTSLFTFLDYDSVPWNNNNAEHAIKAFARLRRDLAGLTTERGIRDYLILLSVCESCRIKGMNFLDFLRSGERDIDSFAAQTCRALSGRVLMFDKT